MEQKKLSKKALEVASRTFKYLSSNKLKLDFITAFILECPESFSDFIDLNKKDFYKIIPKA